MRESHVGRFLVWVVSAVGCAAGAPENAPVRPGIDVLLADSLHLIEGRRVGLLTNQSGVDADSVDDVTRMLEAGVHLTAIFSPEHGFRGALDVENIGHGVDSATGLPIFSLYGEVREPSPEMLAEMDVLVVDLQDIGGRPYTYISTTLRALRAAGAVGVDMIVLDRPNPIGGILVQGPVLETAYASWIGMLPVPLRHGMTLGELARLGNDVLDLGGSLTVVPASGWRRSMWFDETALPWIRPSPNMPSVESATHYPGIVLFERTNLSVGRGTPLAFQVVAAPWLRATAVADALRSIPGVTVRDTTVRPIAPTDGKFGGLVLPAVRFLVTDREQYDPVAFAVRLLDAIGRRHPDSLAIQAEGFDARAGTDAVRRALEAGVRPETIIAAWEADLVAFAERRRGALLYP